MRKTQAAASRAIAGEVDVRHVHAHDSSELMRMERREVMPRESLNLSIERTSIERARRYSEIHGTSISRLVDEFLASLPVEEPARDDLSPVVRRLYGIAKGGSLGIEDYHEYLMKKYGDR